MEKQRKLELATDFYQLSVSNVYEAKGFKDRKAVFDVFIRRNPFEGGYSVFAGLEQVIDYINNLKFDDDDIKMLKENHPELTDSFLEYLRNFKFSGEIYAMEEGEIFFPSEPVLRVKTNLIEAQIIETAILAIINHQSLIATKASRICSAAGTYDPVLDFGLRRAHGTEAGLYGARACIIGGCVGTSNVEAEYCWDTVSKGTISHAFIMAFDKEIDAFRAYAKYNPDNLILLADTYDTLNSGVKNAIQVFTEEREAGRLKGAYGIRLDSGDLTYLSVKAREMFDEAGFESAVISASNDLDEYIISDLRNQGAKIGMYGVGTKMITADGTSALGGVYKLAAIERNGKLSPKIKVSNDPIKITNPGYKKVLRFYDNRTNIAIADLITLNDEVIDETKPLTIYHPVHTWKKRTLENFHVKELLKPIFVDGKQVYESPKLSEIRENHLVAKSTFWPEYLRLINPSEYHVDISDNLFDIKKDLLASVQK
ncbi:nicotinate phosphoribosyltransferase [Anaerofustis sp. NSJ-163]|uniref:nicotinate phosphoribosyltransferase n=1 Tax=Anaerofustis sp. NSJ-163 TaxID=2944391 RepID=UPI00209C4BC6|nr:nicotinate phosphoribosyltransferase [Anaerofustis sp. NSJ-163]MCO8194028.1 nicotinate phosphoribosyltransferase [Anaerofustis sp. NSJ-163]